MASHSAANVSLDDSEGDATDIVENGGRSPVGGLSDEDGPSYGAVGHASDLLSGSDDDDYLSEIPNVLIVTGVPDSVFDEEESKDEFEMMFREFDAEANFLYMKSFRRARIVFDFPRSATRARICLHQRNFLGSTIKCFFAQPVETNDPSCSSQFLLPPKPEKQFLISPPCSPPDGWEPVNEKEPSINYDLIAAIANLAAGEAHEVRAASESVPGIIIHACEDPEGFKNRPQILQTRCPHAL